MCCFFFAKQKQYVDFRWFFRATNVFWEPKTRNKLLALSAPSWPVGHVLFVSFVWQEDPKWMGQCRVPCWFQKSWMVVVCGIAIFWPELVRSCGLLDWTSTKEKERMSMVIKVRRDPALKELWKPGWSDPMFGWGSSVGVLYCRRDFWLQMRRHPIYINLPSSTTAQWGCHGDDT